MQSEKFLELLDNNAEKFLFACYDKTKKKKGRTYYYPLDTIKPKLLRDNKVEKFCVYITVNETKGSNRKKENISRCRAIWVEDDSPRDEPRTDWPLAPSMVVQSSPGKYHYYWLTSTVKFDEWNAVMATMVDEWGCDNNAKDISRVMRLPGFVNNKYKNQPPCELIEDSGRVYKWFELKAVFPPKTKEEKNSVPSTADYSEDQAIKALLNSENYHGSLVSISMSLTNKGVSRELQHAALLGLMNKIPKSKRRPEWEDRISDEHLYECIDSALKKKDVEEKEEVVLIQSKPEFELMESYAEFPPGKMGRLCEEILEMAPYKNREVALAGAMGLIAGITGRTYNVSGMGLNLYIAILADSGIGKANLKDSINLALRAGSTMNLGSSFAGLTRFTGPKAIFDMLANGLSKISVLEEAGLISESTAGDASGITRVLLDLYTSSGFGKFAGGEGYSDKQNSIPVLHAPSLSVVSVSTPKSFLRALKSKSADVSGEVARLWMMRSIGKKPYLNRDRRKDFSNEIVFTIGKLISECLPYQPVDNELRTIDIEIPEKYFEESDRWVDLENKYIVEADHLKRTLCSRAWAKILKMAAVCSVFNGKNYIGDEEYEWATKSVEKELDTIRDNFTHDSSDDLSEVARSVVGVAVVKSINKEFKDEKKNSPFDKQRGIVTRTALNQILKNNKTLCEMNDDPTRQNPKTGLDKALTFMLKTGLLELVDETKLKTAGLRIKLAYRITQDFVHFMD